MSTWGGETTDIIYYSYHLPTPGKKLTYNFFQKFIFEKWLEKLKLRLKSNE